MRLWKWPQRITIAASITLNLAFFNHDVFHRPFVPSLIEGLGIFGGMLLFRGIEEAGQSRRTRTQEQSPSVREQDASGG